MDDRIQGLPFQAFRRDVHSQCGEDGVIEYLLGLARIDRGYFIEFGAWDGLHLSNCAKLAAAGWPGCFIEGDAERFAQLRDRYQTRPDIATINSLVGTSGDHSLDAILTRTRAPADPALLSIDIDGNDYHVWAALAGYCPLLVIVEFNPTIPENVEYVQEDDPAVNRGCSLRALWKLGHQKGYSLVAATDWNAFFMRDEVCRTHDVATYQPAQVKSRDHETFLFHGYDGTLMLAGARRLLWHDVEIGETELQVLPPELRQFPVGRPAEYYAALGRFRNRR